METRVAVPLRSGGGGGGGKKMRKRKELDALGRRMRRGGGVSSQDGLLSDSTDCDEGVGGDSWRAKRRSETPRRAWARRRACAGVLRACTLVLVFACVVATTTVMWLFIDVREQATFLRNQLDQVVAGSQGVPEALQKCHSMSKQLQQNQTALFLKLNTLASQLDNFTSQVTVISASLARVEDRFKTAPELIKVPHDLDTLTTNMATVGSQLHDLAATVADLKERDARLADTTATLVANVTNIRLDMSNLSLPVSASPAPSVDLTGLNSSINALRTNLKLVNDTLTNKIQWAQEDLINQNKAIVSLQERNENVSTRVSSLQNECSAKATQLTTLVTSVDQLSGQVKLQDNHWTEMSVKVNELSADLKRLESNTSLINSQLHALPSLKEPISIPTTSSPTAKETVGES